MDIRSMSQLSASGKTLSVEERSGLEVAMRALRFAEKLQIVQFWGKIDGAEADYIIVSGMPVSMDFPQKSFFACTTRKYDLQRLPELSEEFVAKAEAESGPFKGDPTQLLGADADAEDEEEEDEEEDEDAPPKPKKIRFSEMHRLSHTVRTIDDATAIVPKGAFMVTPTHHLAVNGSFAGLNAVDAAAPTSFLHFRRPHGLERKSALEREGLVKDIDFLDSIAEDEPAGQWSLRVDMAAGQAVARSLIWPGYHFFHNLNTREFGGCYFGDGRKNNDLQFML